MTRRVLKNWRIGPALLALACLLALLAPGALAAEAVDKGTDSVEIGQDGTVTLVSGHIAGEQVASVQFQLTLGEGDSFTLDPAFAAAGKITYVSGTGTVSVYIAGPTALMAPDQTRLTLGTVADPAGAALVEGSLRYVYGKSVVQQRIAMFQAPVPADAEACKEQIRSLLESPKSSDDYSEESYAAYLKAAGEAAALLEEDSPASPEQLQEALNALQSAINNLTLKGLGSLKSLLDQARSTLAEAEAAPGGYTAESLAALRDAVSKAEAAVESGSEAEWTAAEEALSAVMSPVPVGTRSVASYDPGGSNSDGTGDTAGVGDPAAADGTDGTQPTPTTSATPAAAPAGNTAPNTGDQTALWPWTLVMLGSLAALTILAAARRRG